MEADQEEVIRVIIVTDLELEMQERQVVVVVETGLVVMDNRIAAVQEHLGKDLLEQTVLNLVHLWVEAVEVPAAQELLDS